jgi:hypothetical protein
VHAAVAHLEDITVVLQHIQVTPCQGLHHAGQAGEQGEAGLQGHEVFQVLGVTGTFRVKTSE